MSSAGPHRQQPPPGDHSSTSGQSESKRSRQSRSSSERVVRGEEGHGQYPDEGLADGPTSPHESQSRSIDTSPTSSRAGPSRGGRPQSLTVRRREANRLAAQRFRSRKKGYQESLEEKVRELQEENALLQGRLEGRHDMPFRPRSGEPPRPILPHSTSADWTATHGSAADIRMAALDAANRRLQEENRALEVEVQRVSGELEMWRRWANQNRDKPAWYQELPPPPFTRAQSNDAVRHPLSTFSDLRSGSSNMVNHMVNHTVNHMVNHMVPPVLPPPLTIPNVKSGSSSASSAAVRLPPIRLTPPSTAHAILPSPNLPQPPNLSPTETKVPKPPLG